MVLVYLPLHTPPSSAQLDSEVGGVWKEGLGKAVRSQRIQRVPLKLWVWAPTHTREEVP